jgi:hypothetical protein
MRKITLWFACAAIAAFAEPAASQSVNMPGGPVPAKFSIGHRSGDPLIDLPPATRLISPFGERAVISPDGTKIAFVSKMLGDAFEYDIRTGTTRNLTVHMPHAGFFRVHYLHDGSYILTGARRSDQSVDQARENTELFWMDAAAAKPAVALNQRLFEGVALGRRSNMIAWTTISPAGVHAFGPGAVGDSKMMVGEVEVSGGTARLKNIRTLKTIALSECVMEAQDILPDDSAVTGPCYDMARGHKAWSIAVADGKVTNYPLPPNLYGEVEGLFPDGKRTFTECGNDNKIGLDLCILELKANAPRYTRLTYAQDFGNFRYSNPTVSQDGRRVAFQFGFASDPAGMGRGILLMDLPAGF